MEKKNIYIAYTGGTIGMLPSSTGYRPIAGFLTETLKKMPEFHRDEMPNFTIYEYPSLIDSSDMSPQDWQTIASDIQRNYRQYHGFIILHGTDTMAYTASALSFIFENLDKPVIVTGSQIPLAELRSDGQINLLNALYLAANYPIPEVSLFFNNKLLRGNRSRKLDADGFDAFHSPNFEPLLIAGIDVELVKGSIQHPKASTNLQIGSLISQPIGIVTLYPGINADLVKNVMLQPVKAIILLSYGVGNAPNYPALLRHLELAFTRNITVVNCTQCPRGTVNMEDYANGHALREVGVLSGTDMTPEATLAKLHYLLSQPINTAELRTRITTNLRGELTAKAQPPQPPNS